MSVVQKTFNAKPQRCETATQKELGRSRARSMYDCKVRSGLVDILSAVHPMRPGIGRAPLLAAWPFCAFALMDVNF